MTYCKNCKWHNYSGFGLASARGEYVNPAHVPDCLIAKDEAYITSPYGDCKDYNRKWWKFWVKPNVPAVG